MHPLSLTCPRRPISVPPFCNLVCSRGYWKHRESGSVRGSFTLRRPLQPHQPHYGHAATACHICEWRSQCVAKSQGLAPPRRIAMGGIPIGLARYDIERGVQIKGGSGENSSANFCSPYRPASGRAENKESL